MINYVDWQVTAGGQTVIQYYPEDYTYDDVYNNLINECGISEDVQIRKL